MTEDRELGGGTKISHLILSVDSDMQLSEIICFEDPEKLCMFPRRIW